MANSETGFFYWYRRYKVRAQDMTDFQSAMVETARGIGEGVMGAAVLKGMGVVPVSGFMLSVDAGIAIGASGYLEVLSDAVQLNATAAVGAQPCRSLVVCTPDPTPSNYINSPTTPFTSVPLRQLQKARVQLIPGTPGQNPDYPSKGPNDVILAGLKIMPGTVNIDTSMLDFEVRDSIGVNSLIAQNQVRFDNRLRPYRASPLIVGIKPSQNVGSGPAGFSYPGRLTPSLYPLAGGLFSPLDSFLNFSTGAITGGDTTTPMFSPVIPTGNNSIVCLVTLDQNDVLRFNYGTQGGFAQCLAAIHNQTFGTNPGSLADQDGNFPIAYVIVSSFGGSISDVHVIDSRAFLGSGAAAAKFKSEVPAGVVNGTNSVFTLSSTPSDPESLSFYVDENILEDSDYSLVGATVTITNPSFRPATGQSVYAKYLVFGAVTNTSPVLTTGARFYNEVPMGAVNGVNDTFNLTNTPIDAASLFFYVDENVLEATDYSLAGTTVVVTNADRIPQTGQSVYAKYLFVGVIPGGGGGGGGGSSARTVKVVSTDFTVPVLINDYVLNVNTTMGAVNVTMPDAFLSNGFALDVKNTGSPASVVNVIPVGGQGVDGMVSDTIENSLDSNTYIAVSGSWFRY
jgi:hypothetical protein